MSEKIDNYMAELTSWLECGNRTWLDDNGMLDIERGGSAGDIVMVGIKRLMGKIEAVSQSRPARPLEMA